MCNNNGFCGGNICWIIILILLFCNCGGGNMWGFTADFLDAIEADFPRFFREDVPKNPAKAEMFLPLTIGRMLADDACAVKVLRTADKWYGVTYAADKPVVMAALREKAEQGLYPDGLWK